jgi:hypothetical protein
MTLFERGDVAWTASPDASAAAAFVLPRWRVRRRLAPIAPAAAFLAVVLLVPQRQPASAADTALADDIAADLSATVAALTDQQLITPAEEERLQEEIERIRRDAEDRVDASTWEAADALREQMAAGLAEKQDAVKWAQDSLSRYAAAAQAGGAGDPRSTAAAAELSAALDKLAKSGMLGGAPPGVKEMLQGGKLPADARGLGELSAALAEYLAAADGRIGEAGQLARAGGRFDPAEFPIGEGPGVDGDGRPGRGGINRGRADAALTWGQESERLDRFKSQPLPPGAARSPDDWAPIVVLPGAPQESARLSAAAAARQYAAGA